MGVKGMGERGNGGERGWGVRWDVGEKSSDRSSINMMY